MSRNSPPRTQRSYGLSFSLANFSASSFETIASLAMRARLPPRERERAPVLLQDRVALVLVDAVDRRELVLPGPWPHRIIDCARIGKRPLRGLLRGHSRIKGSRPTVLPDLDSRRRRAARGHPPDPLAHFRRVDTLVDDPPDPPFARRGAGADHRHTGLLGVAGILLLDRHHDHEGVVDVGADDPGHTGG